MAALVQLDPAPMPPLPEIDEDATALANGVLKVSRKLIEEAIEHGEELTQACCLEIAAAATKAVHLEIG